MLIFQNFFSLAIFIINSLPPSPMKGKKGDVGVTNGLYIEQDWDRQNPTQIVTEMCGFVTILSGTFLLHKTKDMADGM